MPANRHGPVADPAKGIVFSTLVGCALLLPMALLLGLGLFGSIARSFVEVFGQSPSQIAATFSNILNQELFILVSIQTFKISAIVTLITVVIGYATALAMWRSSSTTRVILLGIVMFPLFTSVVVRTYAWVTLFNRNGLINSLLLGLGVIDAPLRMIKTDMAVVVGLVQVLLPFAILPIFATLLRINEDLVRASTILGARSWRTFFSVVLPLSRQGTAVAATLVFVLCLGTFVSPAILGGPKSSMIANLIGTEMTSFFDLREGTAMALLLLVVTLLLLGAAAKIGSVADHFKGRSQ